MSRCNLYKASIYMTLYAVSQSIVWALVRALSEDLSTSTLFFFRNVIGFLTVLPLFVNKGNTVLSTNNLGIHVIRAFAAFAGGLCIFYSLAIVPLTTVVAITFTAPIFASLMACLFLKETMNKPQFISLLFGFIGTLIVLRPNLNTEFEGVLFALFAALLTAVAFLTVKKLSATDNSDTIVAYPFILILPLSAVMANWDWTTPNLMQVPLLIIMGLGISFAQYCMVKAFSLADASAVLPIDFLRLIIASFIGVIYFNDHLDLWAVAGGIVILASSLNLIFKKNKATLTPPNEVAK